MMAYFYETNAELQIMLLVISQLTVLTLTGTSIYLYSRKCHKTRQIGVALLLLLNIALYVMMQLDNQIFSLREEIRARVPYIVLMLITILSLLTAIGMILDQSRNRRVINHMSINESFDNLPTGVCFFNEAGLPVLCNRAMHRFSFAVTGKDVQYISDLENCISDERTNGPNSRRIGKIFVLEDGSAWKLENHSFTRDNGEIYTQYVATDVTQLHKYREDLQHENEQLKKVQADLKKLSANVVAVTREEEILNTKIRVHDEMGRCLVAVQTYLKEETDDTIPESIITAWQRAISMLKYNDETPEEDMMSQIRKTCEYVNMKFIQSGNLPREEGAAYILTCSVRECVTNAVRYANASELYADFSETEDTASVTVTNNGKEPEKEIVEGGGLSNLRRRVERAGGTMSVRSFPRFRLTVTVPKEKGGIV